MDVFLTFFPVIYFLYLEGSHFLLSFSEEELQRPVGRIYVSSMTEADMLCIRMYEELILFRYSIGRATIWLFFICFVFWLSKIYLDWTIPEDPLWYGGFLFVYDIFFFVLWYIFRRQFEKMEYLCDSLYIDITFYKVFRKLKLHYLILQQISSLTGSLIFGAAIGQLINF